MKSSFFPLLSSGAVVFCLLLMITNCQKDPDTTQAITDIKDHIDSLKNDELDSAVQVMGFIPQPDVIATPNLTEEKKQPENDSIYCTQRTYEYAPGREESLLMDPTAEVISPGFLLRAESITTGAYTPIILMRKPLCISLSLTNVAGSPKDTIFDASKRSSAAEGIQRLLNRELKGNAPARLTKSIEKIYSYQQCKVALGANYNGFGYDVSAAFDYANTRIRSRYLVKFYQEYYSISIDLPEKPSDFFVSAPKPALLGSYSPVYVSNVKYGRILLFLLESERTESEMNASIEASFNGFVASGGINAELHLKKVMENCSMKLFVVGGSAPDAASIQNASDVDNFIKQGANFSNQSPGVPIAYTLRFLKDNSVAKVIQSSRYTVRQCEVVPAEPFQFQPNGQYEWVARHIRGDADYGGDGFPIITGSADLYTAKDREVWMKVNILFEEKRADETTGSINENVKLFTIPPGYKLVRIVSDDHSEVFWQEPEGDHSPNTFEGGNEELVSKFIINGDTGGDDLPGTCVGCDRSWAMVFLNKITVAIRKIQ